METSELYVAVVTLSLSHLLVIGRGLVHHHRDHLPLATSWFNLWLPKSDDQLLLYVPKPSTQSRAVSARKHFGYTSHNGPDVWPLEYPECSGARQSPIDLEVDDMYRLEVSDQLRWHGYKTRPLDLTLTNNRHTIQVSGRWETTPSISGGPLEGEYTFSQLHFHWGSSDTIGSEHTVNNVSFPMEMHLVHFRKAYGSQDEALKHEDGLAVVCYLFTLSERPNPALNAIVPLLDAVVGAELEVTLERPFPLQTLDVTFSSGYVTYGGSLTTPPCSEVVTWIVSSRPLALSAGQLAKFRHLGSADTNMANNFRPVQPTNGRPVFYVS